MRTLAWAGMRTDGLASGRGWLLWLALPDRYRRLATSTGLRGLSHVVSGRARRPHHRPEIRLDWDLGLRLFRAAEDAVNRRLREVALTFDACLHSAMPHEAHRV